MFSGPACALKYSLATNTCDFLKNAFHLNFFSLSPFPGERYIYKKQARQEDDGRTSYTQNAVKYTTPSLKLEILGHF